MRILDIFLVAIALWFLSVGVSASESETPETLDDLDARIKELINRSATPGAAVVVVEGGETVLAKGYGYADVQNNVPMTENTVLAAGSLSKNLTSLGVLRLVDDGRLSLLDKIADVAPAVVIDNPWEDDHPILIEHLLEHTAGIEGSTYEEYATNEDNMTPTEYAEKMQGKIKVRWTPGYFYSYANPGHTLAAAALESVCTCNFDSFMESDVFRPLGMTDSTFLFTDDVLLRRSKSYNSDGKTQSAVWKMGIRPSGSLQTTIKDLGKLIEYYATRGASVPGFLPESLLIRMENAETSAVARSGIVEGGYSLGNFGFFAGKGAIFHGHTGATEGFKTWLGYDPQTGAGFALTINGADEGLRYRLMRLLGAYVTRDYLEPQKIASVPVAQGDVAPGWYAPFTHNMPFRSWLWRTFSAVKIDETATGIRITPIAPNGSAYTMVHTGNGTFRRENQPIPLAAFVDGPDGDTVFVFGDAFVRAPGWAVIGGFTIMVGALILGAIALFHSVVWAPMRLMGRLEAGPGADLRKWLAISGGALVMMFAAFVYIGLLGALDDSAGYGRVGPLSISFLLLSLLGPIAALFSLWAWLRLPSERTVLRVYGAFSGAFLILGWVYLAMNGWAPFISWRI
ncbi:MAG: serine hydrolase domain-containing protein [Pseudomonadota bacterium]